MHPYPGEKYSNVVPNFPFPFKNNQQSNIMCLPSYVVFQLLHFYMVQQVLAFLSPSLNTWHFILKIVVD